MERYEKAAALIQDAKNIVVLTGAGMSTESGLKDFRSKDGLGSRDYEGYYPEEILSRGFFFENPDLFYRFLREKLHVAGYAPNKGHRILAEWEEKGNLAIITQNIDGFHQRAGSKKVLEIHGTLATAHCTGCRRTAQLKDVLKEGYRCACGGLLKPDVVLYDEEVHRIQEALLLASQADLLLILGTSLRVYPAAALPDAYGIREKPAIIINRDETPYARHYRVLEINEGIGAVLEKIQRLRLRLERQGPSATPSE